ncbi:MAG: hypothetical protein ACNS62_24755 [Candidatus Cyclobacteriaceae bacterium M3_2C_046]
MKKIIFTPFYLVLFVVISLLITRCNQIENVAPASQNHTFNVDSPRDKILNSISKKVALALKDKVVRDFIN